MKELSAASGASELVQKIAGLIVNPLIVVMFAFALVGFLWGVRGYITHADDAEARRKGTEHIMWGLIGMLFMVAAFSIVRIVLNTFGLSEKAPEVKNIIGG